MCRPIAAIVLALALAGCSDEPERGEATNVAPTTAGDEASERPSHGAGDEAHSPAATLPQPFPEPLTLETRRAHVDNGGSSRAPYDEVLHPDEVTRTRINQLMRSLAEEMSHRLVGRCHVRLAHPSLVSVRCRSGSYARGGMTTHTLGAHFAIAGDVVWPFPVNEALVDGTDLGALAAERCEEVRATRDVASGPQFDEHTCRSDNAFPVFTPTGINVAYPAREYDVGTQLGSESIDIEVPYEELRNRIRVPGPLAAVLGGPAQTEPRAVPEERANAWAVSPFGTQDGLLQMWMGLSAELASPLRLEQWRGGLVRIVSTTRPDASIAEHFGTRALPIALDDPTQLPELRWARTTSDLNLRTSVSESSSIRGTLPRGAIVVAAGGELGRRGSWAATRNPLGPGHVAARYLVALERCVPTRPDGFATNSLIARVRTLRRGRPPRDALLFAQRVGRQTHIALHGVAPDGCTPTDSILALELPGHAADLRLTTTHESGGSTLLIVGIPRERDVRYAAFLLSRRGAVWTGVLHEANEHALRLGERVDGRWFPISLSDARHPENELTRLEWTGRGLEPVTP